MKKFKKIAALLLAMVMALAMAVPAMADTPTATVEITNLDANASAKYIQIIKADPTKESGWAFFSSDIETAFVNAFNNVASDKTTNYDSQTVIWMMILAESETDVPEAPEDVTAATASQIEAGMDAVRKYATNSATVANGTATFDVTEAGVYVIDITSTNEEYTYKTMAQYVEFAYTNGASTGVVNGKTYSGTAKSSSTPFTKAVTNSADKVAYIGDTVEYTVSTVIPYWTDSEKVGASYSITDVLVGGTYVGTTSGTVDVTYQIGSNDEIETTCEITTDKESGNPTFTLDLTRVKATKEGEYENIVDNKYANQTLTVKYSVKITDETTSNTATPNKNGNPGTGDEEKVYTGNITLTKKDEESNVLAGAKFKVYYETTETTEVEGKETTTTVKHYAIVTQDTTVTTGNAYVVTGWTTTETEATEMTTDSNGEIVVRGLDNGVTYKFQETEAPEGYSKNTTDATATWTEVNGEVTANSQVTGIASMTDTKLNALPSTGGIGTTIFTVAGCMIMIAAGGMLIVSRRRKNA